MLRSVKVIFENGDSINTNMAEHVTNKEILEYYKVGRIFNLGQGENDLLTRVKKCIILDGIEL